MRFWEDEQVIIHHKKMKEEEKENEKEKENLFCIFDWEVFLAFLNIEKQKSQILIFFL